VLLVYIRQAGNAPAIAQSPGFCEPTCLHHPHQWYNLIKSQSLVCSIRLPAVLANYIDGSYCDYKSYVKSYKAVFANDKLPSYADIQDLLDFEAAQRLSRENFLRNYEFLLEVRHRAERKFKYVISNLKRRNMDYLRQILKMESPSGKTLVDMSVEYSLDSCLALLVSYGATLGHGRTPKDVYHDAQSASSLMRHEITGRVQQEIRNLLDSTMINHYDGRYTLTQFGRRNDGIHCVPQHQEPTSWRPWPRFLKVGTPILWFHVPSTNVSI
jgi:hypothetical protein